VVRRPNFGASLELNPQYLHRVERRQRRVQICRHIATESAKARGRQVGRADTHDRSAKFGQGAQVRPRDARVDQVAHDADAQAGEVERVEPTVRLGNDVGVEQSLRRVSVAAVACVEHGAVNSASDELGPARSALPHHQRLGAHRLDRARGVGDRLAFGDARTGRAKVHNIGAEPASSDGETEPSARGNFEKQVGDNPAFERVESLGRRRLGESAC